MRWAGLNWDSPLISETKLVDFGFRSVLCGVTGLNFIWCSRSLFRSLLRATLGSTVVIILIVLNHFQNAKGKSLAK